MKKDSKIYIAGHRGMVGSAILRKLENEGYSNLIYATSAELDLRNQVKVTAFFKQHQPEFVFLAAAKVGGIKANNDFKAEFLHDNLAIQNNVIHAAYEFKVKKLLFLGSSCIYPKLAPQPLKEEYLLTGSLEDTNDAYAIAKIAGIKLCEAYRKQYNCNFISAMPTNLYGPNDNYALQTSHVLPALIRKFHEAKERGINSVELWGTGTPKREFLHVDDLAEACLFLMLNYNKKEFVNVGWGSDISIKELGSLIRDIVGYKGDIHYNTDQPDGTPQKLLDVDRINALGWKANITLKEGLRLVYENFKQENT